MQQERLELNRYENKAPNELWPFGALFIGFNPDSNVNSEQ